MTIDPKQLDDAYKLEWHIYVDKYGEDPANIKQYAGELYLAQAKAPEHDDVVLGLEIRHILAVQGILDTQVGNEKRLLSSVIQEIVVSYLKHPPAPKGGA